MIQTKQNSQTWTPFRVNTGFNLRAILSWIDLHINRTIFWLKSVVVDDQPVRKTVRRVKTKNRKESAILRMTYEAYSELTRTVGRKMPETGGIFFGPVGQNLITKFVYDPSGTTTVCTYSPNVKILNPLIHALYNEQQLEFKGFAHSHPPGATRLSQPDIAYAQTFFTNDPDVQEVYLPIIMPGDIPRIYPYVLHRNDSSNPIEVELEILDKAIKPVPPKRLTDFSRLEGAVDVEFLKTQKVVIVGAGGSNKYIEGLARTGLGQVTAIDFDVTEESNLVRQGYQLLDVGMLKVEALGTQLKAINPDVKYTGINDDFTQMTDVELDEHIGDADLLVMATDSFEAQALGNVMAQRFKIPALFSGFYKDSKAAELVFTIPDVTPACFRCAVSPRYQYQKNERLKVPSIGNTMFHSLILDGYMGLLSMAILHRQKDGLQFSHWFGENFNQNLIQIQLHPDFGQQDGHIFQRTYGNIDASVNFQALWQTIEVDREPQSHNCPDCATAEKEVLETAETLKNE